LVLGSFNTYLLLIFKAEKGQQKSSDFTIFGTPTAPSERDLVISAPGIQDVFSVGQINGKRYSGMFKALREKEGTKPYKTSEWQTRVDLNP